MTERTNKRQSRYSRTSILTDACAPQTIQEYSERLRFLSSAMDGMTDRATRVSVLTARVQLDLWQFAVKEHPSPLREKTIRALRSQDELFPSRLQLPVCPFSIRVCDDKSELNTAGIIAMLQDCADATADSLPFKTCLTKKHAALSYWLSAARLAALSPVEACGFFGFSFQLATTLGNSSPILILHFVDRTRQDFLFADWRTHGVRSSRHLALADTLVAYAIQDRDLTALKRELVSQILRCRATTKTDEGQSFALLDPLTADAAIGVAEAYAEMGCTRGVLEQVIKLGQAHEVKLRGLDIPRTLWERWTKIRHSYTGEVQKAAIQTIENAVLVATGGSFSPFILLRACQWASSLYISLWCEPEEKPVAVLEDVAKRVLTSPKAEGGRHFPQKATTEENSHE